MSLIFATLFNPDIGFGTGIELSLGSIDPELTRHFWFTKGSSRLDENKIVTWEWEMYKVSTPVVVKEILKHKKISFEWEDPPTTVDIEFKNVDDSSTFVTVTHYDFTQTGQELLKVIKDSTAGFTTVLDGLKAFLEYRIDLNLIGDKFPNVPVQHG